ncbi:unnamed protein product [Agarophyton chilense]
MTEVPHRDAGAFRRKKIRKLMDYLPPSPVPPIPPSSSTPRPSSKVGRPLLNISSKPEVLNRRRTDIGPSDRLGSGIQKPRKRFRKKVSSIFADNTDLKKRVEKLFLDVSTEELLELAAAPVQPSQCTSRTETCTLEVSKEALEMLNNLSSSKEAAESKMRMHNHPQLLENAVRIWNVDGVHKVRKHIADNSPISFPSFVRVFGLGEGKENTPLPTEEKHNNGNLIVPPKRLSHKWFKEYESKNYGKPRNPLNRIGIPAILRKNARRNERGYRIDGTPRSCVTHAVRRTKKPVQRRVPPRTTDAFQMLVEVATEQNARKRGMGRLLEYGEEGSDMLRKSHKRRKTRSE